MIVFCLLTILGMERSVYQPCYHMPGVQAVLDRGIGASGYAAAGVASGRAQVVGRKKTQFIS